MEFISPNKLLKYRQLNVSEDKLLEVGKYMFIADYMSRCLNIYDLVYNSKINEAREIYEVMQNDFKYLLTAPKPIVDKIYEAMKYARKLFMKDKLVHLKCIMKFNYAKFYIEIFDARIEKKDINHIFDKYRHALRRTRERINDIALEIDEMEMFELEELFGECSVI